MTTTWMECFPFSLTATTIQFTGTQTVTLFGELVQGGRKLERPAILTGLEKKNPFRTSERSKVPRWHSRHKEKVMVN